VSIRSWPHCGTHQALTRCCLPQCLASGFDGWLTKPFRIEDLAGIMDAILA
jgi:CheY-like chemotaxis protein